MSYQNAIKSSWHERHRQVTRRGEPRRRLAGTLPGRLITAAGQTILCVDVNVSASGIGLVTREKILPGTNLLWIIDNQAYKFQMLWSLGAEGQPDLFRYGFKSLDLSIDFDAVIEGYFAANDDGDSQGVPFSCHDL